MLLSRLIILSMKIDVDVCSLQAATVKLEVYDEIAKAEVDELTKKESVRTTSAKGRLEFCFVLLIFSINLVNLVDLASSTFCFSSLRMCH